MSGNQAERNAGNHRQATSDWNTGMSPRVNAPQAPARNAVSCTAIRRMHAYDEEHPVATDGRLVITTFAPSAQHKRGMAYPPPLRMPASRRARPSDLRRPAAGPKFPHPLELQGAMS